MITKKEMGYINSWASKVPYPGEEYCEMIFTKLQKCFELYNKKYLNRKYTIQFSNNEEVDFGILEKNVAHLLGIDYKSITRESLDYYRRSILKISEDYLTSYILLQKILENKENILDFDSNHHSCEAINYYRVGIKCDIFSKLADLSNFHYGCINFDKDIYNKYNPTIAFTPQSTKLLYTSSDEVISPYFMMGLKKDDSSEEQFIVETLMAVDDPTRFFTHQEVVIPTQILTDDNGILDKKKASASEKIRLIREYQNIVNAYNINNQLNIFGDYFSCLMSQKNKEDYKLELKK